VKELEAFTAEYSSEESLQKLTLYQLSQLVNLIDINELFM
jgi:hypothetical protein